MKRRPALAVSEERGVPALYDPNLIVLALKGVPLAVAWDELRSRAYALEKRHAIPYPRYLPRLKRMNRHDAQQLFIAVEQA